MTVFPLTLKLKTTSCIKQYHSDTCHDMEFLHDRFSKVNMKSFQLWDIQFLNSIKINGARKHQRKNPITIKSLVSQ